LFLTQATRYRPNWALEADIKGFFDNITHEWILKNIPIDKGVLKGWLKAGYFYCHKTYDTNSGVPQGGPISPIIANMVLDGLSNHVTLATGQRSKRNKQYTVTVRYADDFIITCKSKEFLEEKVVPAVNEFLAIRGLWLNPKKTVITNLHDGYNFLGFNFRVYPWEKHPSGHILLIKPSKDKIKNFRAKIRLILN